MARNANGETCIDVVHAAVPGRTRFRIPKLRGSESLREFMESRLVTHGSVHNVKASVITGTILVFHEKAFAIDELLQRLQQLLELASNEGIDRRRRPARDVKGNGEVPPQNGAQNNGDAPWHILPREEVAERLSTSSQNGLPDKEAARRLVRFGTNTLPHPKRRSDLAILASQFRSLPVALLGVSAIVAVTTGGLVDAVVISLVVAVNATLGYRTEREIERTIHTLQKPVKHQVTVIRSGRELKIAASELVPGDVISLKHGDCVPADGRVLFADELTVDESSLTGESEATLKNPAQLPHGHVPLGDRWSMVYRGTSIVGGAGKAVITSTGSATQIGRIERLMGEARAPETPIQRELRETGSKLVMASLGICAAVFGVGMLRGYGLIQMLQTSISLAVAAIPEGLPTVATTTLARGVNRLHKRQILVRRLDSVETLAGVQTICLDKTGTLTLNQMRVTELVAGRSRIQRAELARQADLLPDLRQLLTVALLCNEVSQRPREKNDSGLRGSSTERALVEAGIEARLNLRTLRKEYPLEAIEHRALNRNRMATIHKRGEQHRFIAVKGEPHEVLGRCETILKDGRAEPMTDEDRAAIRAENERMAGEMLRVLGFGFREIGLAESNTDSALTWCGLIGMQDKLRDGAKALIARLHEAGIHTMMITGDQSPTAYAIAQSLGLAGNGNPIQMLDSRHLDEMSQEELNALAPKMHVFSRVDPSDKLKIIRALQENGQVVAMTGDGINDGPALKAADIGIAIGGMELAPKVADMVVLDDDIEPILIALEEGRVISDDIRKSIHYVLATNFSEILTTVLSLVLGLGTPLSAIQLLWMNLLSDIFPELALAAEPAGADVLNRAPRDPGRRIIDRRNLRRLSADSALMTAGALASYGFGLAQYGRGPHAKTLTFLSLTTAQLLYTQSARSQRHSIFDGLRLARSKEEALPPNRYIGMAIGFGLVVEALAIATGAIRNLLGITPLIALDYLAFGAGSLAPFLIKEASKMSPHTLPASQTAKAKQKVAPEKNSRRYCFGD